MQAGRMVGEVTNLEQLLDRIGESEEDLGKVPLGKILEHVGRRSFGPILLLAGLITISPLSGIPGVPSALGVLVFVVAIQLLFRRKHFWMPQWVLRRKIPRDKLNTTLKWSRPPARFIDRLLKPRLTFFTHNAGTYFIALLCLAVALGMPPMELIPFSVTLAGLTLFLLGLALIAHDGLIALVGIFFALTSYGFIAWKLF